MRRQTDKLEDVSVLESSDPFTVTIRASVIRPRETNGGWGRWDRRIDPRWLPTRVSSFSRILEKYYRSTPSRDFSEPGGASFLWREILVDLRRRFHIAVVGATAVGSTNFASFGHHSSPFSIRVFFRGQSTVSRGLTPRHWPSPYSLPFSFFDSDSLSPPCERDVAQRGRERGGSPKKL